MSERSPIEAVCFDLSGVLYEGRTPIEGAAEAVVLCRERGLVVRFVTNTATRSRKDLVTSLARLGIELEKQELFTAPLATRRWIEQRGWNPFFLVHDAIAGEFEELATSGEPDCVVIGDARDRLNYENLNEAFRICEGGAPLIGIGMNRYFKSDRGLQLDAGPFIRAVAWAAGVEPLIMGKPGEEFFAEVVASTGCEAGRCLMIGDDVEGDIVGAIDAGLQAIQVRTGKFTGADEERVPDSADLLDSVADLGGWLDEHDAS